MIPMIDTLALTVDIVGYDLLNLDLLTRLEELKLKAKNKDLDKSGEKILIQINNHFFEVKSNGSIGFAYILHNDLMEIKLAKGRSKNKNNYPLYVRFKSEFLWSNGPENCWTWFKEWISESLGCIKTNKLNRVDLCCHTDIIRDIDAENFKGKYTKDKLDRTNREITGISFGSRKGQIYARIYDKSKEILSSKKLWFNNIWLEKGMDIDRIYNVEFELHRDFFRNITIDDNVKVETCEDLFDNLKPIWEYCTKDWLVLIEDDNERTERASINNNWIKIQNAFNSFKGNGLVNRSVQKNLKIENIIAPILGYITTYASLIEKTDIYDVIDSFIKDSKSIIKMKGKTFEYLVKEKMKLHSN